MPSQQQARQIRRPGFPLWASRVCFVESCSLLLHADCRLSDAGPTRRTGQTPPPKKKIGHYPQIIARGAPQPHAGGGGGRSLAQFFGHVHRAGLCYACLGLPGCRTHTPAHARPTAALSSDTHGASPSSLDHSRRPAFSLLLLLLLLLHAPPPPRLFICAPVDAFASLSSACFLSERFVLYAALVALLLHEP